MALRSTPSTITQRIILDWMETGKSPFGMIKNVKDLTKAVQSVSAMHLEPIMKAFDQRLGYWEAMAQNATELAEAPGKAFTEKFTRAQGLKPGQSGAPIYQQIANVNKDAAVYKEFFKIRDQGEKSYERLVNEAYRENKRRDEEKIKYAQMVNRAHLENANLDKATQKSIMRNARERAAFQDRLQRQGQKQAKDYADALKRNAELNKKVYDATPLGLLTNQWQKFGTVFRRVADALGSFMIINSVVSIIQGFLTSIVQSNAQLEVLDARLSRIARGAGSFEEIRQQLIKLTVTTPFVISDLIEATAKMEGFGVSSLKYLPAVVNWAAAMGRDIQDMAVAFSKISVGSPRTAMLLGTRGINIATFRKELQKTGNEAEALTNIIDRYFSTIAERVSRTFTGFISNIKDMWFLISSIIGSGLFARLRSDVELLYNVMGSAKDKSMIASTGFKIMSSSIGTLYGVIKSLIPLFALIFGARAITYIKNFAVGIAGAGKIAVGSINAILLAVVALGEALNISMAIDKLYESLDRLRTLVRDSETPYAALADAYRELYNTAKDLQEGTMLSWVLGPLDTLNQLRKMLSAVTGATNQSATAWDRYVNIVNSKNLGYFLAQGMVNFIDAIKAAAGPGVKLADAFKLWAENIGKAADEAERLRGIEQAWMDMEGQRVTPVDTYELVKRASEKEGGLDFIKKVAAEANTFYSALPKPIRELQQKAWDVIREELSAATTFPMEEIRNKLTEFVYGEIPRLLKSLQQGANIQDWRQEFNTLMNLLPDIPKKGAKELRQYSDEIAEAKMKLIELATGDSLYSARIEGSQARIRDLKQQVLELSKKGISVDQTTGDMGKLNLDILNEQVAVEENLARIKERSSKAELRLLEARRGLAESETSLIRRRAEFEYEFSGNLEGLNKARVKGLELINSRINEITNQIGEQEYKAREASFYGDQTAMKNAQAEIAELQKEKNKYIEEELNLWADIYNRVSEDFPAAFTKTFRKLQLDLNNFYDEFVDLFVGGVRETTTGIIMDLLYGESGANDLAEARYELAKIRADMSQTAYQSSIITRREGETNEEYAARMRLFDSTNAAQQQMFVYKDQELEQLQRINELEQQRNNIILDRLRMLGQKLTEKFFDYAIGSLMSWAFGRPNPSPGPALDSGVPLVGANQTKPYGGNTYVISGNTIYGMDDFDRQVGASIQRIESRRRS